MPSASGSKIGMPKENLIQPTGIGVGQSLLVRERPLASFHQSREGIQPSDRVMVRIRLRLSRQALPIVLGFFHVAEEVA